MKQSEEKLEIHYLCNDTMRGIARDFFLATMPDSFLPVEHESGIWSSGDFMKDGYADLVTQKTRVTLAVLEDGPVGSVFVWSDVDVVFFRDCREDLLSRMEGKDVLFQQERPYTDAKVNTGFQVLRRCEATIDFYRDLLHLQLTTDEHRQQPWADRMVRCQEGLRWGLLPKSYAAESNRGLTEDSWIYHANCTMRDSVNGKRQLLGRVSKVRSDQ